MGLGFSSNYLTSLDVSNNTELTGLSCGDNQLTSLDVSNNKNLVQLSFDEMPTLYEVRVWTTPFPPQGVGVIKFGSPNAYFSTKGVANIVNLPDTNFLNALIYRGVDSNGDSLISYGEAELINYLDVSEEDISELTGVEAFVTLNFLYCNGNQLITLDVSNNTALRELKCWENQLTRLDVSHNTGLTRLYCNSNNLTSLDVSKNTALTVLHCGADQLTSLDVSNNIALTQLSCGWTQFTSLDVAKNTALTFLACPNSQLRTLDVSNNSALTYLNISYNNLTSLDVSNNTALLTLWCIVNQLTSLDVSNNTALTELVCGQNSLTSLDVSNNTTLTILHCDNNQLTSLDISNNTVLENLACGFNQITNLDVSNNTALIYFYCENTQLTTLDISNNTALKHLHIFQMQTLQEVCVWTLPFPPTGVSVFTGNSPNIYFTTECSDDQAPTIPSDVHITSLTEHTIDISWNPADDNVAVAGYHIYVNNIENGTSVDTIYTITELTENTEYLLSISAYDSAFNESERSFPIMVRTKTLDNEPPTIPSGIKAIHITEYSIKFAWDPSEDNMGVEKYSIHMNGLWVGDTPATIYYVTGLSPNTTYEISVVAYDAAGNRSESFAEIIVTTLNSDTDAPGLTAADTIYKTEYIVATSTEDGMIYLIPVDTDQDLLIIRTAAIDSVVATANLAVNIAVTGLENGIYWLYARDSTGNISEPEAFSIIGVGIENASANQISLYPNPAIDQITVQSKGTGIYSIEITSLNGQIIQSGNLTEMIHQIDISSFQKGVYFITIRSKDYVTTEKIIKL